MPSQHLCWLPNESSRPSFDFLLQLYFVWADYEFINEINITNRKLTQMFINRIEIDKPNQMKNDNQSVCDSNESINEDLMRLYQRIFQTSSELKHYRCYQLIQYKAIEINNDSYCNWTDIKINELYYKFKQYLRGNYILKLTTIYNFRCTIKQNKRTNHLTSKSK